MTSDQARQWIGRTKQREDAITAALLAHWLYLMPQALT